MAERGLTTAAPRSVIDDLVAQVLREQRVVGPTELATELAVSLTGWGPIQELLDTADCEEIWWNDPSRVFYSVAGQTRLSNVVLAPADAEAMVLRAVSAAGRRLDHSQPFVDAPLPDGSRLHVVMPPITPEHWAVNIRRYVVHPTGLDPLVESGTLTRPAAELLNAAVRAGREHRHLRRHRLRQDHDVECAAVLCTGTSGGDLRGGSRVAPADCRLGDAADP